jgi:hypothetical protein
MMTSWGRALWLIVVVCGILALVGSVLLFVWGDAMDGLVALGGATLILAGSFYGARVLRRYGKAA